MSDESPLIDGNIVTDNTGGGVALSTKFSLSSATIRNNVSLRNGAELTTESGSNANVASYASTGVDAYCNVLGMPNVAHAQGFLLVGSNRGYNPYPPGQYLTTTGNYFHHNTVIWDPSATSIVGYEQADAANQPNFFADNTPPDFNMYHLPSLSTANFVYDNNNSQANLRKTFAQYQEAGADPHGTADTKYTKGFPTVRITSPADDSSVGNSVTIMAVLRQTRAESRRWSSSWTGTCEPQLQAAPTVLIGPMQRKDLTPWRPWPIARLESALVLR